MWSFISFMYHGYDQGMMGFWQVICLLFQEWFSQWNLSNTFPQVVHLLPTPHYLQRVAPVTCKQWLYQKILKEWIHRSKMLYLRQILVSIKYSWLSQMVKCWQKCLRSDLGRLCLLSVTTAKLA